MSRQAGRQPSRQTARQYLSFQILKSSKLKKTQDYTHLKTARNQTPKYYTHIYINIFVWEFKGLGLGPGPSRHAGRQAGNQAGRQQDNARIFKQVLLVLKIARLQKSNILKASKFNNHSFKISNTITFKNQNNSISKFQKFNNVGDVSLNTNLLGDETCLLSALLGIGALW